MYNQSTNAKPTNEAKCPECGSKMFRFEPTKVTCANCGFLVQIREKRQNGKTRQKSCKECKVVFEHFTARTRSYCSHKCANTYLNREKSKKLKKVIKCKSCRKVFEKRPSDLKLYNSAAKNKYRYCSHQCWKDGTQTVSSLKKKAWLIFSMYIKERDNWTCFTCGKYEKGKNMHGGHFVSRRHNATLFDERNVHAQCAACNMFRNGEPHVYAQKLIKTHGLDWFEKLIEDSKQTKKFTVSELRDLCEKYKPPKAEIKDKNRQGNH